MNAQAHIVAAAAAVPAPVWAAVAAVAVAALVLVLGRLAGPGAAVANPLAKARDMAVHARERLSMASQDAKPLQRLTDAQFGLAFVAAARMLTASDDVLSAAAGLSVPDVYDRLRAEQAAAYAAIIAAQPSLSL